MITCQAKKKSGFGLYSLQAFIQEQKPRICQKITLLSILHIPYTKTDRPPQTIWFDNVGNGRLKQEKLVNTPFIGNSVWWEWIVRETKKNKSVSAIADLSLTHNVSLSQTLTSFTGLSLT